MTPDDATQELYKTLIKKRENTLIDDIKEFINFGAKLTGITDSIGIPIIVAIDLRVSPDVIQYLTDNGGVDFNYKSKYNTTLYLADIHGPNATYMLINTDFICYKSIQNSLVELYSCVQGNMDLERYMLEIVRKRNKRKKKYKEFPFKKYEFNEEYMKLLKEYCKILNFDYDSLKTLKLDHPEDTLDFNDIPDDNQQYNFIPDPL